MGWEVGGRFQREVTYVCLWLVHAEGRQKPTQHCKAITLQLKVNKLKEVGLGQQPRILQLEMEMADSDFSEQRGKRHARMTCDIHP